MRLEETDIIYSIYFTFAETEYGRRLANQIRYAKYNTSNLPNSRWVSLLGVDVNNLWHMPLTYSLTKKFTNDTNKKQPKYFNKDEERLLLVAAIVHDQGESIVDDISFGDKTIDHEEKEKQAFDKYFDDFTSGLSNKTKQLIRKAKDEIVFDSTTKLGEAFNVIERLGYVRIAIRANRIIQHDQAGPAESGLRWLIADVLANQAKPILSYSKKYAVVQDYLDKDAGDIGQAFNLITDKDFNNYASDTISNKKNQFQQAKSSWLKRAEES